MKQKYLQALAAAAAILAITGFTNIAQAGFATPPFVPFEGTEVSVDEVFADGGLEFTINNPDPSPIGSIFGMMVAIPDQLLLAETLNGGWNGTTIFNQGDLDDFIAVTEAGLAEASLATDLGDPFAGFFPEHEEVGVILAFFSIGQGTSPFVDPGNSLGGFFGDFAEFLSSDVLLVGTGGTCTGTTNGPCTTSAVPEPGSLALVGLGLVGLGIVRRRRKMAA